MYLPPQKIQPKIQLPKICKNPIFITNPLELFPDFSFDQLCTTQRGKALAPIHQQINFRPFTSNPGHNPPKAPNHPPNRQLALTRLLRERVCVCAYAPDPSPKSNYSIGLRPKNRQGFSFVNDTFYIKILP